MRGERGATEGEYQAAFSSAQNGEIRFRRLVVFGHGAGEGGAGRRRSPEPAALRCGRTLCATEFGSTKPPQLSSSSSSPYHPIFPDPRPARLTHFKHNSTSQPGASSRRTPARWPTQTDPTQASQAHSFFGPWGVRLEPRFGEGREMSVRARETTACEISTHGVKATDLPSSSCPTCFSLSAL